MSTLTFFTAANAQRLAGVIANGGTGPGALLVHRKGPLCGARTLISYDPDSDDHNVWATCDQPAGHTSKTHAGTASGTRYKWTKVTDL